MKNLQSHSSARVTSGSLTEKQIAFIQAYTELGGKRGAATEAAIRAGYANGDPKVAKVRASELLKNDRVIAALRDELTKKLNAAASLGVSVLIDLAETGPPSVRLQAAKELLDRGYGPVMSRNAHVVASTSIEDFLARLDDSEVQTDDDYQRFIEEEFQHGSLEGRS